MTVDPNTHEPTSNFDTHASFHHPSHDVANYANSLLFVIYTFSGYEQPFYVSTIRCSDLRCLFKTAKRPAHIGDE